MSKFAAGFSRRRNAAIAAMIVGFPVALGTATASATEQDEEFLADLKQVEVPFNTSEEAIQLGRGVCQTFQSGLAEGLSDAEIRRRTLDELENTGLSGMDAFHLMGVAVENYCPQYLVVAGD